MPQQTTLCHQNLEDFTLPPGVCFKTIQKYTAKAYLWARTSAQPNGIA